MYFKLPITGGFRRPSAAANSRTAKIVKATDGLPNIAKDLISKTENIHNLLKSGDLDTIFAVCKSRAIELGELHIISPTMLYKEVMHELRKDINADR